MSEPVRVVAVDDEPIPRETLAALLTAAPDVELVAVCATGRGAVDAVREHRPDALFLDVQMPGLDGFGVIEALLDEPLPVIVFATAHDDYALAAFDVEAVDYLLKPFTDERFNQALERVRERVAALRTMASKSQTLAVHRAGLIERVDVSAIVWIESADQYVKLHTADDVHLMRESMANLEAQLDPERFLRVHRTVIVASEHVRAIETLRSGNGRLTVGGDVWLPVARARVADVKRRLG